jgi:hypothetical protein
MANAQGYSTKLSKELSICLNKQKVGEPSICGMKEDYSLAGEERQKKSKNQAEENAIRTNFIFAIFTYAPTCCNNVFRHDWLYCSYAAKRTISKRQD